MFVKLSKSLKGVFRNIYVNFQKKKFDLTHNSPDRPARNFQSFKVDYFKSTIGILIKLCQSLFFSVRNIYAQFGKKNIKATPIDHALRENVTKNALTAQIF